MHGVPLRGARCRKGCRHLGAPVLRERHTEANGDPGQEAVPKGCSQVLPPDYRRGPCTRSRSPRGDPCTARLPFNRSGGGSRGQRSSSAAVCRVRALSFCGTGLVSHPPGPSPLGQLAPHVPLQKADLCPIPGEVTQCDTLRVSTMCWSPVWASKVLHRQGQSRGRVRTGPVVQRHGPEASAWRPGTPGPPRGGPGVRTALTCPHTATKQREGRVHSPFLVPITQAPGRAVPRAPSPGAGASCRNRPRGVWGSQKRGETWGRPTSDSVIPKAFPASPVPTQVPW